MVLELRKILEFKIEIFQNYWKSSIHKYSFLQFQQLESLFKYQ